MRSCSLEGRPCQNSISSGTTRKPDQCGGRGTGACSQALNAGSGIPSVPGQGTSKYVVAAASRASTATPAARGRSGIVLMSSVLAFQGTPMSANYAATKAYVQSLAEGLGQELKSSGVDVLASAPGPVATGFATRAGIQMALAAAPDRVARATLAALGRAQALGRRPGTPCRGLGIEIVEIAETYRVNRHTVRRAHRQAARGHRGHRVAESHDHRVGVGPDEQAVARRVDAVGRVGGERDPAAGRQSS